MSEMPDSKLQAGERPGLRPAIHRCGACNAKVDPDADEDMHVCVLDDTGPIKAHGRSWRAVTAKQANDERLKKVKEERSGGRP